MRVFLLVNTLQTKIIIVRNYSKTYHGAKNSIKDKGPEATPWKVAWVKSTTSEAEADAANKANDKDADVLNFIII